MKNLLTENEIRNMMKYANMNKLADGFVTRLTEEYVSEDDELDMGPEPEEAPVDLSPGPEDEMEAPADGSVDVEALVRDLAAVIEQHTGADIEVEDDAGPAEEEVPVPEEEGPPPEPEEEMMEQSKHPLEEKENNLEESEETLEEKENNLEESEETLDEVVNMVARRVAKRILAGQ